MQYFSHLGQSDVMSWWELRYIFKGYPLEIVNDIYIQLIDEQEAGYY